MRESKSGLLVSIWAFQELSFVFGPPGLVFALYHPGYSAKKHGEKYNGLFDVNLSFGEALVCFHASGASFFALYHQGYSYRKIEEKYTRLFFKSF